MVAILTDIAEMHFGVFGSSLRRALGQMQQSGFLAIGVAWPVTAGTISAWETCTAPLSHGDGDFAADRATRLDPLAGNAQQFAFSILAIHYEPPLEGVARALDVGQEGCQQPARVAFGRGQFEPSVAPRLQQAFRLPLDFIRQRGGRVPAGPPMSFSSAPLHGRIGCRYRAALYPAW